jgi:hypothetical protein
MFFFLETTSISLRSRARAQATKQISDDTSFWIWWSVHERSHRTQAGVVQLQLSASSTPAAVDTRATTTPRARRPCLSRHHRTCIERKRRYICLDDGKLYIPRTMSCKQRARPRRAWHVSPAGGRACHVGVGGKASEHVRRPVAASSPGPAGSARMVSAARKTCSDIWAWQISCMGGNRTLITWDASKSHFRRMQIKIESVWVDMGIFPFSWISQRAGGF